MHHVHLAVVLLERHCDGALKESSSVLALVSKGAREAIIPRCSPFELDAKLDQLHTGDMDKDHARLCSDGFRVLAIASKDVEPRGSAPYGKADEDEA